MVGDDAASGDDSSEIDRVLGLDDAPRDKARLLIDFARTATDNHYAVAVVVRALEAAELLARSESDRVLAAEAIEMLAETARGQGDIAAAYQRLLMAHDDWAAVGDAASMARIELQLGRTALAFGDEAEARGHLEIALTVDDPKAYTRPWTVMLKQTIVADSDLLDYVCQENEKDARHLVGQ